MHQERESLVEAVGAPIVLTDRGLFLMRTYVHLLGAVLGFTAFQFILFETGLARPIAEAMLGLPWILILGAFMVVSWLATRMAHRVESLPAQYAALSAFVLAQGLIFVPLLVIADMRVPGAIASAALVTIVGFAALTGVVLVTRKDFSFLRGVLIWGGICAVGLIVVGLLFGMHLGAWFSIAMIALAGGAVLYDTSAILRHYPTDRHVAASLQLFASIAMMFWYVLRLFMSRR
jgi:uncharacterized protein